MNRVALAALALLLVAGQLEAQPRAAPPPPVPSDLHVRFRERRVDLQAHLEGFPYVRFRADYDANRLFYFHETRAGRFLMTLPLDGAREFALADGTRLGTIDWNTRGLRDMHYHAPTRTMFAMADEANEERYNVHAMSMETGALRRVTDQPYTYGFGIDRQNRFLGHVPRFGTTVPYRSCLHLYEIPSAVNREVVCDTPAVTLTWTDVHFQPQGRGVVLGALRQSDRNHETLVYVDLMVQTPTLRVLLDTTVRRRNVATVRDWLDDHRFVYTSDESGFTNVYTYDITANTSHQVTRLREDVDEIVPLHVDGRYVLGVVVKRPYESEMFVVDPDTDAVLARRVFDATVEFLDYREGRALMRSESRGSRFVLDEVQVRLAQPTTATLALQTRARVPDDVASRIVTCNVERVAVPTFDDDPATHRRRLLHAYLMTPRVPVARASERVAFIESFYGGENRFDGTAEILCDAGISVLSPSVRGSAGFGADFAALNDHDLGGNEIIDVIYAGRWLASRLGIPERQIGVYGGSHGGYATMRALTFPAQVNGRREHFGWGFGVSWYGFSNIISFYETCNIPDWVLLEAGDPRTERDRLLDRSPIQHVRESTAALLLLHGENDNRVPVRESRQMFDAMRRAHRRVTYVEFPGQGHGLKGLGNQHRVWTAVFRFLEREALGGGASASRAPSHRRHMRRLFGLLAILVIAGLFVTLVSRRREAPGAGRADR